jgi:hypothetical protein
LSVGYGASVPSGFTEFRVVLTFGWRADPATNSTNFPVFVSLTIATAVSSDTKEAEHGAVFNRTDLYPTRSTGLAGTLTRVGAFSTNSVYRSYRITKQFRARGKVTLRLMAFIILWALQSPTTREQLK